MAKLIKPTELPACPFCGADVYSVDVEAAFFIGTSLGSYGPGKMSTLPPPRLGDTVEPFPDGDEITLWPCRHSFERREQRDWIEALT